MPRYLLFILISLVAPSLGLLSAPNLNANDGSLQSAIARARHAAKPVDESSGHWWVQNPTHGLNARVSADGLSLRVRSPGDSSHFHFTRWHTSGLGYGANIIALSPGTVRGSAEASDRIEIIRPGLVEWFVNRPSGLEHGYTLTEAPSDRAADLPLRLEMTLEGDLDGRITEDGRHVTLHDESGKEILRYEKLKVWDATGRELIARMTGEKRLLAVEVDDTGAVYPLTIDPTFVQRNYLKSSNSGTEDEFGRSLAIDVDTIIVGAPGEDSNATGVNGIESDNSLSNAGAAYIFVRSGNTWTQQAYLKASNAGEGDRFGASVSIDGDIAVVGAPEEDGKAGAAYVFERGGTIWSPRGILKASNAGANDVFGLSVSVSGDRIIVGASSEDSDAIGINGDGGNNLRSGSGAAYIFSREGIFWTQEAYLKASNTGLRDQFGFSVAISGDTALVSAREESSNATGSNGDGSNDLAYASGAAYVFLWNGSAWEQQAYLKASNTRESSTFGDSVALDGDTAVIGARSEDGASSGVGGDQQDFNSQDSGAAYVFVRNGTSWTQQAYLKASNNGMEDYFGSSVDLSGDYAIVGAHGESSDATGINGDGENNLANSSGAAYVFRREGTNWFHQDYLKSSNSEVLDIFGIAVAVDGTTAVVGAAFDDSASALIDGDQSDNSAVKSGAAYVFSLAAPGKTSTGNLKKFKTTRVGRKSKSSRLVITNTGELPLTNVKYLLGGKAKKDFRIIAPLDTTLDAGESATIKISFKPKASGKRSATLKVNSNSDPVSVKLSGKGR
jgi:hypothetical protein